MSETRKVNEIEKILGLLDKLKCYNIASDREAFLAAAFGGNEETDSVSFFYHKAEYIKLIQSAIDKLETAPTDFGKVIDLLKEIQRKISVITLDMSRGDLSSLSGKCSAFMNKLEFSK